ncbi:hypothetical protein ABB37_09144 [Leptomonas pyrrhocoris]|uniref:Uncharacterized protein n=1 Tax=Leptomonas pyrrhocoris TaxID=157538 RepID=A0A0M9FRB2_LEPPY|nr:hypothetical protein ABB37_09144 [Leptomonas pyrrhocoris]KPA74465.1 hypothetical protein ABB37_09144 [Leptomonas pyrrhocoris]|eukprot:XP_015652904.1 hypothetical protein ABB37_09144 [Leptomonas pyrrhocoris]
MFYTYADKQGESLFGSWQLRQVAFDTMRRYLYYSEPTRDAFPLTHNNASSSVTASAADNGINTPTAAAAASSQPSSTTERESEAAAAAAAAEAATDPNSFPSKLVWKRKMKVTAVVPVATRASFVQRTANERDLYQLEIKGESRPLATGEYPSAGPLLCPSAGLSRLERARCNANNAAYIRDPFFLKELFDALRDQFEEMTKAKVCAAAESGASDGGNAEPVDFGVQTLVSPRRQKTVAGVDAATVSVRVVLRCRDEREFRRLWYVLQTVLGYDKLIVRPYRGLPPYDPRNGVAFAHIPMAVWHTFKALDKAVFYTFMRGNFYALESTGDAVTAAVPKLKRVLEGAYLCITHDSVLCMRESGSIPRWLRLAEVQDFHWDVVSRDNRVNTATPFCAFLSDAPIPDLFFEPTAPAYGADAIASYDPLVDVRRVASVIHDTCFASYNTRRVIRIKEVPDASIEAYVGRMVREGTRLPGLQTGSGHNSTLSCPLPKEQLAVVWQQVQSELLERGNMANRAAIPIYRTNARDVELSEDQLSTVERELEEERERRDEVVGMPLERARQLERRRRAVVENANAHRTRPRHRDVVSGSGGGGGLRAAATVPVQTSNNGSSNPASGAATTPTTTNTTTITQVMPLTMELLQTPQLQGQFATTVTRLAHQGGDPSGSGSKSERSSQTESTAVGSDYSSYVVPGARYLTQEEWQSGGYASPVSSVPAVHDTPTTAAGAAPTLSVTMSTAPAASSRNAVTTPTTGRAQAGAPHRNSNTSGFVEEMSSGGDFERTTNAPEGGAARHRYAEERTINEIVNRSMAALDGSRADLDQMDRKKEGRGSREKPTPS